MLRDPPDRAWALFKADLAAASSALDLRGDPGRLLLVAGGNGKARMAVGAALFALPAWSALSVQMPAPTKLTVDPDTAHTPLVAEENVTGLPDPSPWPRPHMAGHQRLLWSARAR